MRATINKLKRSLYRKGKLLNEGELRALTDKHIPVWASYTDANFRLRSGVFEVVSTESTDVMLEDGSCFSLDFQFLGDDQQPCKLDDGSDERLEIYRAVRRAKN